LYGTSMASADVSAAAALLWSNFEECSSHQIRYVLVVMAYPPSVKQELSHPGCDKKFGYEIVQVKAAFDWLDQNENGDCNRWDVPEPSKGVCSTDSVTLLVKHTLFSKCNKSGVYNEHDCSCNSTTKLHVSRRKHPQITTSCIPFSEQLP
jgi:hypothetical protein